MLKFDVVFPRRNATLEQQLDDLADQLPRKGVLQASLYLSDAANQWSVVQTHPLLTEVLAQVACSYVEQPPFGAKVAIRVLCTDRPDVSLTGTGDCRSFTADGLTYFYHTVRLRSEEAVGLTAEEQTRLAFLRHKQLLEQQGLNLKDHCHRTWLYVRDIDRHYAGVVKGRNDFFAREGLTKETHYIASTGIEGSTMSAEALVAVDFLSVKGLSAEQVRYLRADAYLNPTHQYGVAFERATALDLPCGRLVLVSGTASIDKNGLILHEGDVLTQAGRLFLNIEKLLEDGGCRPNDLQYIVVYLRDAADAPAVSRYLNVRFPGLPKLLTLARVCRPGWLIEVEGVALRP